MAGIDRWLVYRATRFGFNFLRSADFRSVTLLRWRKPENLFQPFTDTLPDRYPDVFRFARDRLGDDPSHHFLSLRCSTAAEAFTLPHYFSQGTVKGLHT